MDRNLALEFVRVTEAAAISAARWFGKGDKNAADGAAVQSMRDRFNCVDFSGEIMIGEGDKDKAPLLFIGEKVGTGKGPEVDLAVDPLECTENTALGKPNSISVLAAGPKGSLMRLPGTYMDQIAVGPQAKGCIDITSSLKENIKNVAAALDKDIRDITVMTLDRERHKELVKQAREAGARVLMSKHGSIAGGLATSMPENEIDMMIGIMGSPEGVITAAGLKCLNGDFQGILKCHNKEFEEQAREMGITDLEKAYSMDDLAKGDKLMFVATGVSTGPFLKGVRFTSKGAVTHSVVMRSKTKTSRMIEANHHFEEGLN